MNNVINSNGTKSELIKRTVDLYQRAGFLLETYARLSQTGELEALRLKTWEAFKNDVADLNKIILDNENNF